MVTVVFSFTNSDSINGTPSLGESHLTVVSKHWPLSSAIRPTPTSAVASSPSGSGKPVFSKRLGKLAL